jgi:ABC-type branched-subunit amino acid transport system substrate-binding protein
MPRSKPEQPDSSSEAPFAPPPRSRKPRPWPWIALLSAVVVAVAATGGLAAYHYTSHSHRSHHSVALCPGSKSPSVVFHYGKQCVGVTDGTYPFLRTAAGIRVENEIARENAGAARTKHVTVALLAPLTPGPVTAGRILDELRGAYAAQHDADSGASPIDPKIELVLANEGSQEQAWRQVVARLKPLKRAPANLVTVIGMGLSNTQTQKSAWDLNRAGIPMIGSVITSDELNGTHIPGLARVIPGVGSQVAALQHYLVPHGYLHHAVLIYDNDSDDLYTSDLTADLQAAFGKYTNGSRHPFDSQAQIGDEFRAIAGSICPASGMPPTLLYAGREKVLSQLISDLQNYSQSCAGKPLTVITASDADALSPTVTRPQKGLGKVTVIYSDIVNATAVTSTAKRIFRSSGISAADLDPWTIATYNALTAATRAISIAGASSTGNPEPATLGSVITSLQNAQSVSGATGFFSIDGDGNENGLPIPIMELANGSRQVLFP